MPFFGGKKNKGKENCADHTQNSSASSLSRPGDEQTPTSKGPSSKVPSSNGSLKNEPIQKSDDPSVQARPKLVFHCQQAHGSPTGIISGFANVKELYQQIADCYDMKVEEILFCTLNTHKIDMSRLLGGQIGLEDFIFAHVKGQPKEVEITKSEDSLGLTITDNGAGYAFIKRIKEGSILDRTPLIAVGDHIEKIDGKSVVGCRHIDVAKILKEIPKGHTFILRTVEPLKSGFSFVSQATGKKGSGSIGTGRQTLRISSKGQAKVEMAEDIVNTAVDKINGLLESFMGINDTDLAQQIWDAGKEKDNPHDFAVVVDSSDLREFGFTDDFVFDLWGAISDAKSGRLTKAAIQEFSEKF